MAEETPSLEQRLDRLDEILTGTQRGDIGDALRSHATVTLRSYININILVDTSQSMGIGATDNDQRLVAQATGCAS